MGLRNALSGQQGRKRLVSMIAGAAMLASVAVAAPASAGDAEAAAVTVSITVKSPQSKPAQSCKDLVYTVNVSGLNPDTYYSLKSKIVLGTKATTGYLASSPLVNGANRVEAFICSSSNKAGAYKAYATVLASGTKVASATPKAFNLKVKPVWTSLNASGTLGGAATVTGSLSPSIDVAGKAVKVYFKPKGRVSYKALGSARINSNGSFTWKWTKSALGTMYVKYLGSTYTSIVNSPAMTITASSAGSSSLTR